MKYSPNWYLMKNYRLFYSLSIIFLILDQLTKFWVVNLSGLEHISTSNSGFRIIPGFFNIIYNTNEGAAWGMLSGYSYLLSFLAVSVLILIFIYRKELEFNIPQIQFCFGLICSGIIGNLIDRMVYGHVIDFIDVNLIIYRWPTFNIADSAIVVGVMYYTLLSFILKREHPSKVK